MTQPISFVVLSTDLNQFKDIRRALSAEGRGELLAGGNDTDQLYDEILRLKPAAAIIALGSNPEVALKFIERLNEKNNLVQQLSQAARRSPRLRSSAVCEREQKSFSAFLLVPKSCGPYFDRISDFSSTHVEAPKKKGKMIAVFSSKGGCGTSFIATNLAAVMSAKTCLVDLNLQAGDLPLFLGVEANYQIADMVEKRSRLRR